MKKFKEIIIINPERFLSKISINENGCWIHCGAKDQDGYVVFKDVTQYKTHRYSYALFNKGLSTELVIDHKCRNRSCCNPDHLRAVTPTVNSSENRSNLLTTICKNGHDLTGGNLSYHKYKKQPDHYRNANCKQCARDKNKLRRSNPKFIEQDRERKIKYRLDNLESIREKDKIAKRKDYARKKELKEKLNE